MLLSTYEVWTFLRKEEENISLSAVSTATRTYSPTGDTAGIAARTASIAR